MCAEGRGGEEEEEEAEVDGVEEEEDEEDEEEEISMALAEDCPALPRSTISTASPPPFSVFNSILMYS